MFPTLRFGWLYYKGEDKDAEEGAEGEDGGKKEKGKQKVQPIEPLSLRRVYISHTIWRGKFSQKHNYKYMYK